MNFGIFKLLQNMFGIRLYMGVDGGAGGGAGDPGKGDPGKGDPSAELAALKAELADLKASLKKPDPEADPELREKARIEREANDKKNVDAKALERAITFNLKSQEFLKNHGPLLPPEVSDIFAAAEKEKYENQIEKDAAIKSGIVQSFFSVQANMDLLTPGQKSTLDEYLKLTKTGKQDKAQATYEMIFEPAFEMLKRIKKAEALNKGHGDGTDDGYKKMLMEDSTKHYLRERK